MAPHCCPFCTYFITRWAILMDPALINPGYTNTLTQTIQKQKSLVIRSGAIKRNKENSIPWNATRHVTNWPAWINYLIISPVADPEGSTAGGGGVTKSARGATWRRVREGEWKFLKNECKWCILSPFYAEFVLIFSQILCVIFAFNMFKALIYGMRENFHLSCRGSYKDQEGSFFSFRSKGWGWCLPEKTDANFPQNWRVFLSSCGRGIRGLPGKFFDKPMQMVHS